MATISATGRALGVAAGTSMISATLGAVTGSTLLTVGPPILTAITVTPASPTIAAGTDQQFTATGLYTDGSRPDISASVTWSSATPAVATISATGRALGVAAGTSMISATLGAVTDSTLLTVTAPPNTAPVAVADSYGTLHDTTKSWPPRASSATTPTPTATP